MQMLFKMVQILPMTKAPFTNDSEVNYLFDGALIVSEDSHVFFVRLEFERHFL